MPIQAIQNEIEVELTHKCNWNCPYCAIKVHTLPNITEDVAISKINRIPDNSIVTLSGGEPGLLSFETVRIILRTLKDKNCTIYLNTNGMFLKNFPFFLHNFKQIIYHCSENLDLTDEIIHPIMKYDIRYMIIVNDDNFHKLNRFLTAHPDIKFDIVQATYNKFGDGVTLSAENRNKILTMYNKHMTTESIKRLIHEKEWELMTFI